MHAVLQECTTDTEDLIYQPRAASACSAPPDLLMTGSGDRESLADSHHRAHHHNHPHQPHQHHHQQHRLSRHCAAMLEQQQQLNSSDYRHHQQQQQHQPTNDKDRLLQQQQTTDDYQRMHPAAQQRKSRSANRATATCSNGITAAEATATAITVASEDGGVDVVDDAGSLSTEAKRMLLEVSARRCCGWM